MKVLFLTSAIKTHKKDKAGNSVVQKFPNHNAIVDNLKKYIGKYDNFLFVASDEHEFEHTQQYFEAVKQSFELTLPFKNYYLLDGHSKSRAKELVNKADFIYLSGGHVPTQNKFFTNIRLRQLLKDSDAVIIGCSAGSMNCAEVVYCPPEIEGEGADKSFQRYIDGLALTKVNIFPHYNELKNLSVDGLKYEKDILLPDSFHSPIMAYSDRAYVLQVDGVASVFGTAYIFSNGKKKQICTYGKSKEVGQYFS